MTTLPPDPLAPYLRLLQAQPGCQVQREDDSRALALSPQGDSQMTLDLMVHRLGSGNAWRYDPTQSLAEGDLPHAWVTLRESRPGGGVLHHEVLCDPARLSALLHDWLQPPAATPATLVLPARPPAPTRPADPALAPTALSVAIDPALLTALPDAETAQQQLQADLTQVQLARIAQHWPRDNRGRWEPRRSVLLAAYGPATRKRQPCLLITSATASAMPAWRLAVSAEFADNQRHHWQDARWRWSNDAPPTLTARQAQALDLIAAGQISAACALFGVQLGERLRRLAVGLAFQRYTPSPPNWTQELHAALYQLAPWRLAPGLQRIQDHLAAANRKPPKPGSWARKLFWFSGQRQQVRWGPGVRVGADGAPEIELIATAANDHLPQSDWQRD